jgi:glycosyltransferase involved in cell wall biosynthesis
LKLYDSSLKNFIEPVSRIKGIDKIIIVRDKKGPEIEKVDYFCPPLWTLKFPIVALFVKFFLMIKLSIKEKPVLIHGFLLFPHGLLAFICGKITRKPVGISLIAGPAELYINRNNKVNIGKLPYGKPMPKLSNSGKVLLFILKKTNIITVTGNFTRSFLMDKGIDGGKIMILPHYVDQSFRPLGLQKKFDVISVGRLSIEKNLETLIGAIGKIKLIYPSVKVGIIGIGDREEHLKKLTRDLGLIDNITFFGYQKTTYDWYNRGKVTMVASPREGFPFTVIESMRCGVPVIAADCGDINDVVINGHNGVIIKDYLDIDAFAKAILELLNDTEKLSRYSSKAITSVKELFLEPPQFIWGKIFDKILD